jgi:uncharacterized OB-fold protein
MTVAGFTQADFQQAIAEGRVVVAVCSRCGKQQAIPSETCFTCGSDALSTRPHDGGGRAFSWVVCHFPFDEEYRGELPYTVVMVALDGGGRVYGRYASGCPQLAAGMRLVLDAVATKEKGFLVYRPGL